MGGVGILLPLAALFQADFLVGVSPFPGDRKSCVSMHSMKVTALEGRLLGGSLNSP